MAAKSTTGRGNGDKHVTGKRSPAARDAVAVQHTRGKPRSLTDVNFHDIEKLFQDRFERGGNRWPGPELPEFADLRTTLRSRLPDIDMIDRRKELVVKAELPGCDKDDITVTFADGALQILAKKVREDERKTDNYVRREILSREYMRSITLPAGIDTERAEATMKRGVLRVKIPKVASRDRTRVKVS